MTNPEENKKPEMDEIVTETYDKSLHLSNGAPRLDPPGAVTPSIYDDPEKDGSAAEE